jgi:hypothetical protein
LSSNLIGRRSLLGLSLIAILALAMLLAAPRQGLARASKASAACSSSPAKRESRACAREQRRSAHARLKAKKPKKRHARHAATKKKAKKKKQARQRTAPLPAAPTVTQGTPLCEDGSAPIQRSRGTYSCDDESEPVCENGSEPTLSSSSILICPIRAGEPSGPPICEDESVPARAGDGSYACDDGSEPECEDGSSPTLSSDGSALICNAVPNAVGASVSPEAFESAL